MNSWQILSNIAIISIIVRFQIRNYRLFNLWCNLLSYAFSELILSKRLWRSLNTWGNRDFTTHQPFHIFVLLSIRKRVSGIVIEQIDSYLVLNLNSDTLIRQRAKGLVASQLKLQRDEIVALVFSRIFDRVDHEIVLGQPRNVRSFEQLSKSDSGLLHANNLEAWYDEKSLDYYRVVLDPVVL